MIPHVLAALAAPDAHALELSSTPLVRGDVATFVVTGATPGAAVVVVAIPVRQEEDAHPVPQGVQLAAATADATGTAVLRRHLHDRFPLVEIVLEARERDIRSPPLRTRAVDEPAHQVATCSSP